MIIIRADYHPGFQQIASVDTDAGESPHFLLTMGGIDRQGTPEATGTDGRAVPPPH